MSDDADSGRRPDPVDVRFAPVQEETKALERRLGMLAAEVRDGFDGIRDQLTRVTEQNKFIEGLLLDLHSRLDRALNAIDGMDVRKRLSAVEEVVAEKPKRRSAAARK